MKIRIRCFIFVEYFETVQKPLSNYNQECVIQIEKAEQAIILALDSIRGANIIKKIFKYSLN